MILTRHDRCLKYISNEKNINITHNILVYKQIHLNIFFVLTYMYIVASIQKKSQNVGKRCIAIIIVK